MAIGAALVFAAPALATTRFVSQDLGSTDVANDCAGSLPFKCLTISHAVSVASPGDVIQVAPGDYDEAVAIDKQLHLVGAKAGVDARSRPGTSGESIVRQGFAVQPTASGTSIDGFLDDDNATLTPGIDLSPSASGYRIVNNIIRGYTVGIQLGASGVSHSVIRHNALIANNASGIGQPGTAIYGPVDVEDVEIDSNSMTNHSASSITLAPGFGSDVTITGNSSDTDGPMKLQNLHGASVTGNQVTGTAGGPALALTGGNADLEVRGNDLTSPTGSAVDVSDTSGSNPNRAITVIGNNLHGSSANGISVLVGAMSGSLQAHFNRIVGNALGGISNQGSDVVQADDNWWGCQDGPGTTGCDTAQGVNPAMTWLRLKATADRGRILTNGDTTPVRATFVRSNALTQPIDASDFPPATVGFTVQSPPDGTVAPASAPIGSGVAQTVFKAGATATDTAGVRATLDNGTADASFVISSQAGPQGAPGTNGTDGTDGTDGTNGTNGTNGQDGATGPQGPAGPAGPTGPQGQQGPAGPSTPASPRDPNPVLILSNSLRATKQRIVAVSITCPVAAGLCDGRLGIGVGASTLGNTAFLVNGGNRAVIRLRGSAKIIKAAIRKKKVTVVVLSRDNAGTAALTSKVVKFRR